MYYFRSYIYILNDPLVYFMLLGAWSHVTLGVSVRVRALVCVNVNIIHNSYVLY